MDNEQELYPCDDCGKLRTKAEGGTTFTVCDECWDKHYPKSKQSKVSNIEQVREGLQDLIDKYGYSLEPSQILTLLQLLIDQAKAEGRREVIKELELFEVLQYFGKPSPYITFKVRREEWEALKSGQEVKK